MITLFQDGSQLRALQFFNQNRARVTLLATPAFIAELYYAERKLREKGQGFDFNVMPLDVGTFKLLAQGKAQGKAQGGTQDGPHVYVVADPEGESVRLTQLQEAAPGQRFVGLGRDLFPALAAQRPNAIFSPIPQKLGVHTATLVFATPRSGSSLLADILTDLGAGRVIEHLRLDLIEVLTGPYDYDIRAALRNFLNFASVNGHFGTKFITHFLSTYLKGRSHLTHVTKVCAGMKLRVLFLDRDDKVAQAISGHLASKRGLWHITSEADVKKLQETPQPVAEFHALLPRYIQYREQKGVIDAWRPIFPEGLSLSYEADLLDADLPQLAGRLADFVGLPRRGVPLTKAALRQRIADEDNLTMAQDFREKFQAMFGVTA